MQNSFEKQVQEKMESLQFTPTPPVWQNIQKQIRPKKDRKRLLLWLPVLILILGGGWWWLYSTNINVDNAQSRNVETVQPKKIQIESNQNNFQPELDQTIVGKVSGGEVQAGVALSRPGNKKSTDLKSRNAETMANGATVAQLPFSVDENPVKTINGNIVAAEDVSLPDSTNVSSDSSSINSGIADVQKVQKIADTASELKINAAVVDSLVVIQKSTKNNQKHILIGLIAQAGVSGIGNGFRVFSDQRSMEYLATPSAGSSGQFNGAPPIKPPQKGKMFAFGISASKSINQRFAISIGVQYRFYSTKISVGQQQSRDTIISNNRIVERYYANSGSKTEYQNGFHFIAVPVALNWQLLKSAPLRLQAGISLQQLVGTNALLYDAGGNVFYRDEDVFENTQVFSELGLTYAVWDGKKTSLHVGPQMQYGLSGLMKVADRKHLYSLGVTAQVNFKAGAKL
jgi:hypothetical protein